MIIRAKSPRSVPALNHRLETRGIDATVHSTKLLADGSILVVVTAQTQSRREATNSLKVFMGRDVNTEILFV